MCSWECVYICVCVFVCVHSHEMSELSDENLRMRWFVKKYTYVWIYIYIYIHTHTHTPAYVHACTLIFLSIPGTSWKSIQETIRFLLIPFIFNFPVELIFLTLSRYYFYNFFKIFLIKIFNKMFMKYTILIL